MCKSLNVNSVPAIVGIVGPIVVVVGDLAASLSMPGYSLVRKSVSSLALEPIGWLQSICFLAMGLLLEIFVAGLYFNIRRARGFHAGIVLLAYGLGLLFPTAILSLAPSLKNTPDWKNIFIYTIIASVLAFALILGALFAEQRGWFGLYERIIILNALVWVEVVAIHLLRTRMRQEPKPQHS
jgi:hypothetical protein